MTPTRHIKKDSREREISVPDLAACATLAEQDGKRGAQDESRILWEGLLHGLTIMTKALRKYLKVERCEHCGR